MLKYTYSLLSPEGPNSRLSVLIFHRILSQGDSLFPSEPTAEWFDRLLGKLKKWFNVIPLQDAVNGLNDRRLPSRPLCITFDDGYADNYNLALPILKKHGLTATFFIATGYLDGGCMFNDKVIDAVREHRSGVLDLSALDFGVYPVDSFENKRSAIDALLGRAKYIPSPERERIADAVCKVCAVDVPHDLMMSRGQVREMYRQGMEIGGHTRNHPILAVADATKAIAEITDGKSDLEEITGATVKLFAYPNGKPGVDFNAEHVSMVREAGFLGAVSTAKGVSASGADVYQLPRFTPWDKNPTRFGIRMGLNLCTQKFSTVCIR
ncbi:MAG: polysaccharide deacetylase family protein [Propionivibrio sp.]|nr:polysaccharide deacetylase family protein [Propionivibrio sp.]